MQESTTANFPSVTVRVVSNSKIGNLDAYLFRSIALESTFDGCLVRNASVPQTTAAITATAARMNELRFILYEY